MEKRKLVGADDLGWRFHAYHVSWIVGLTCLFVFLDLWLALLIVGLLGFYFIKYF